MPLAWITIEPMVGPWWVAVAIAIATVAMLVWTAPEIADVRRRRTLTALRVIAALALLLALLRPTWVATANRAAEGTITIALDRSLSMTLPDESGQPRFETLRRVAKTIDQRFSSIDDGGLNFRWVGFDHEISAGDVAGLVDPPPRGRETDLEVAIQSCIDSAAGPPPAGLVLVSDGTQTAGGSSGGLRQSVRMLDAMGVPLFAIGIGASGISASRDVAVHSLPEDYQLFTGNMVDIDFVVHSQGVASGEVKVEVRWVDADDATTVVAERTLVPTATDDSASLRIPVRVPTPGLYQLQVEAMPIVGETVVTNNRQVAFVDVRQGGGRLLYVEGSPRMEQLFLRRALRRFPDIDLTYRLIPPNSRPSWPIELTADVEMDKFDVILWGDLPADAVGPESMAAIAAAVDAGAGLVTLGGTQAYAAGGYGSTNMASVLPIEINRQIDPAMIQPPIQLRLRGAHPVTRLGDVDGKSVWETLSPMNGATNLGTPKRLPGVNVLLEDQNENPMLVIGNYGRGRVASLAFDSTWRWWRSGDDESHRRFWRQLLLWSLDRDDDAALIQIDLDRRRMAVDETTNFVASIEGADDAVTMRSEVILEDGSVMEIAATAAENEIRGSLPTLPAGIHRLRVATTAAASSEVAFEIVDRQIELERPSADLELLRGIARMTASHGGDYYAPDEVDQLVDDILKKRRDLVTPIVEKTRIGDDAASSWALFAAFTVASSVQWFLRRRWGLI